jgi:RHH-type proline utilization regulon transcriptional repressor/proline dehydrogenase/delta 1-pyrroline-5-carboxylate dehydrogenase
MSYQKDFRVNETIHLLKLVEYLADTKYFLKIINPNVISEIKELRKRKTSSGGIDAIMKSYPMYKNEFLALMGIAEALIRIPDSKTAYSLLADKVKNKKWFVNNFKSFLITFYSFGLGFTCLLLKTYHTKKPNLLHKLFLPFIYWFSKKMMSNMALQFIVAEDMNKAILRTKSAMNNSTGFSFDMLGETARTLDDAAKYYQDYQDCIEIIKENMGLVKDPNILSVSVKLTSLCPRYDPTQIDKYFDDIYGKLLHLCKMAKEANIPLFVDAEEVDKLDFSFKMFEKILQEPSLKSWNKFGIVIQAYQKRAFKAIDHLYNLAKSNNRKIFIRLVKGAYWDTEIKIDQVNSSDDYALFTRKEHTDISYMACARKLSLYTDIIYPCFATHNIHSINFVQQVMKGKGDYEFQYLFGMGEDVYKNRNVKTRVYAPVGDVKTVLPYLIRRLLENGAKHNFINTVLNDTISAEELAENPINKAAKHGFSSNKLISMPSDIFIAEGRLNSKGVDMVDININKTLEQKIAQWHPISDVTPIINGEHIKTSETLDIINPSNLEKLGICYLAGVTEMDKAIEVAKKSQASWNNLGGFMRAEILERVANIFEANMDNFIAVLTKEAGKNIKDSVLEVREAVDFLRYYAHKAKEEFTYPIALPGVDGEKNYIKLEGRGVFLCISPWNFPLAIFTGQIAGALAAGNTVLAKPAESTNMVAYMAVKMFLDAGIPKEVIHLITSPGKPVGEYITKHKDLSGVAFTGSENTAKFLNRSLANRDDYILPFIAETGGQNCMIVDSTALTEQVARDVVSSAFQSAGQRCSALRVLYIQEDIADKQIQMIKGMAELLSVSLPWHVTTDVGPIISKGALETLNKHKKEMAAKYKLLFEVPYDKNLSGYFFSPCAFEIDSISALQKEVFGPILHIIRYKEKDLEKVVAEVNSTGYGLTFGLHTRIDNKVSEIIKDINAGNIYVNRNQIGAIVGSQPFGGHGKSGTGPKAGGPFYLHKFANEKTVSIDLTATGGNADLLNK